MQFRIPKNQDAAADGNKSQFRKVSSALFLAGSLMLAFPTTGDAFVPASFSQRSAPSTQLFYTMPDVTNMKAREMRQELESYGINTQTLFDKREFEQALIEARRNYEQTLNDVMGSTRPKEKKVQTKRKTVNYDRSKHQHEKIYAGEVTGDSGEDYRYDFEKQFERQRQQREQRQQRRRTSYRAAEPNPVGNFGDFDMYGNNNGPKMGNNGPQNVNVGGRRRYPGNGSFFEEDPLFEHEKQAQHFGREENHHYHHDPVDPQYDEYHVGGRKREARAAYNDPAKEMKYQKALQEAYSMKVEDLQHELNNRGISTKHCMIVKDFCVEYAKAIAEDRKEKDFDDDDDYDPSYRDVVMQKYDPSMWV